MSEALYDAPAGVIVGGWPYVVAAYSVTAAVFAVFFWSLISRDRKAKRGS